MQLAQSLGKPAYAGSDAHFAHSIADAVLEVESLGSLRTSLLKGEIRWEPVRITPRWQYGASQLIKAWKKRDSVLALKMLRRALEEVRRAPGTGHSPQPGRGGSDARPGRRVQRPPDRKGTAPHARPSRAPVDGPRARSGGVDVAVHVRRAVSRRDGGDPDAAPDAVSDGARPNTFATLKPAFARSRASPATTRRFRSRRRSGASSAWRQVCIASPGPDALARLVAPVFSIVYGV